MCVCVCVHAMCVCVCVCVCVCCVCVCVCVVCVCMRVCMRVCVQAAHVCTPLVFQTYTPVVKDHGLWLGPLLPHLVYIWRDRLHLSLSLM